MTIKRMMASIISLLGIGLFALPAGILSAGFVEEIKKKSKVKRCPHCGGKLDSCGQHRKESKEKIFLSLGGHNSAIYHNLNLI